MMTEYGTDLRVYSRIPLGVALLLLFFLKKKGQVVFSFTLGFLGIYSLVLDNPNSVRYGLHLVDWVLS